MSITDDIETFGRLQAALARAFADRETLLREAGADEPRPLDS